MIKSIEVAAAIIKKDNKILSTQRGYGSLKGFWEFPGGKLLEGETPEEALIREIREELEADIQIDKLLTIISFDYPDFHLTLHCFLCTLLSDQITLVEHSDAKWLSKEDLDSVPWLPANAACLEKLKLIL